MNRLKALFFVSVIYLLAFCVGYFVAQKVGVESNILRALIATLAATVYVFLFSTVLKNSSVYDPYWSVQPLVIVPFFIQEINTGTVLILALLFFWGIRLTVNWVYTFTGFSYQDWRYVYFKEKFPKLWPLVNLFGIHLMPTVVVFLVMLPAIKYLQIGAPIYPLTFIFFSFGIFAVIVQLISDTQMHKHRKRSREVLETGLWRYSRHPNYFGEITVWFMVALMLVSVDTSRVIYGIGALLNLAMFMRISIPLMEERQCARKPKYSDYIQRTSALVPWPKKAINEEATKKA